MTVFSRTLIATFLFTGGAHADGLPHGVAPAGGGLDAVEAAIDGNTLRVKSGGVTKAIPIPLAKLDLANTLIAPIAIGEGKHVLDVHVAGDGKTFDAILAGNGKEPIFAGFTGYLTGEMGEREGHVVLVTDRDETTKFVLVGDIREDTRICGQATTPLSVRGLDARTMQLRGASLHRIEKKERDAATRLAATTFSGSKPPLARLLAASGASSAGAPALTDGKPDTVWSEARPGDGHGEFVTMRAPPEVPLQSIVVTVAPPEPSKDGAAPRTFFVATDERLFHVTMPEDAWRKPGVAYEVAFPEAVRTSCVAIVLDEAYDRDLAAPIVSIAEVSGRSKLDADGASLEDVAKELSGARADEAAAILRRGGDPALGAVSARWASLDGRARAFAIDVASSAGTCGGPAMELLTRALADADREVRRRALGRIERCSKNAAPALADAIRSSEEPRRMAAATLLASIAPAAAFDPVVDELGIGSPETRHALRAALGRAAAATPREKMAAAVANPTLSTEARLDLLRGLGPRLGDLRAEATAALAMVLAGTSDFRTRYLAVEPLLNVGDFARLGAMIRGDPDWPVRAHAIEVATGKPELAGPVADAWNDPEPRVREASLHAFGPRAADALAHDPWSFVRVAAADALGTHGSPESNYALGKALADPSAKVRAAAVNALGASGATSEAPRIRARLDDAKEDTEVRALSARTLGRLCVQSAADRLTQLALLGRSPVDEADERLGMAALEGLGLLHPADIEKRLAPLRAKDSRTLLRRAADQAVSAPGSCRR